MNQDFGIKYGGRGLRLEIMVESPFDKMVLMRHIEKAARGEKLNMCLTAIRIASPNRYAYTLILNTDEDLQAVGDRCKEAICSAHGPHPSGCVAHSCVTLGGVLTASETREFFSKVSKLAAESTRR